VHFIYILYPLNTLGKMYLCLCPPTYLWMFRHEYSLNNYLKIPQASWLYYTIMDKEIYHCHKPYCMLKLLSNYIVNRQLQWNTSTDLLQKIQFFGAFAKLQKATISFIMSVCPSAHMVQLPLDGFSWNLIFEVFFLNLSRKFKFH